MMVTTRSIRTGLLAAVVVLFVASLAEACPTCRQGLANDASHANMVRGYFWSIIFMMSMPFLIFGGLGSYFYWQVLQARAAAVAVKSSNESVAEDEEHTTAV